MVDYKGDVTILYLHFFMIKYILLFTAFCKILFNKEDISTNPKHPNVQYITKLFANKFEETDEEIWKEFETELMRIG